MSLIQCFDVASVVLDEATKRFAGAFTVDKEKERELRLFCEIMDHAILPFDEVYVAVHVDEETRGITIKITCGQFEVDGPENPFHELFRRSNRVAIRVDPDKDESCCIEIRFECDGIWTETGCER